VGIREHNNNINKIIKNSVSIKSEILSNLFLFLKTAYKKNAKLIKKKRIIYSIDFILFVIYYNYLTG